MFVGACWRSVGPLTSSGVPSTLFKTSLTILLSYSTATTFLHLCNIGTVMFPVPGPTSSTTSEDFNPALSTMAVTTAGFFRKCCPIDVLGGMREAEPPLVTLACWADPELREVVVVV